MRADSLPRPSDASSSLSRYRTPTPYGSLFRNPHHNSTRSFPFHALVAGTSVMSYVIASYGTLLDGLSAVSAVRASDIKEWVRFVSGPDVVKGKRKEKKKKHTLSHSHTLSSVSFSLECVFFNRVTLTVIGVLQNKQKS